MKDQHLPPLKIIKDKAELFGVAADSTRLQILCFMSKAQEACVSEIAEALGASVATVSHHLQIMKAHNLFETERMGTKICYKLVENWFAQCVVRYVCDPNG